MGNLETTVTAFGVSVLLLKCIWMMLMSLSSRCVVVSIIDYSMCLLSVQHQEKRILCSLFYVVISHNWLRFSSERYKDVPSNDNSKLRQLRVRGDSLFACDS
jgi:hypothetical protein